jgi:hypothetical protein
MSCRPTQLTRPGAITGAAQIGSREETAGHGQDGLQEQPASGSHRDRPRRNPQRLGSAALLPRPSPCAETKSTQFE